MTLNETNKYTQKSEDGTEKVVDLGWSDDEMFVTMIPAWLFREVSKL